MKIAETEISEIKIITPKKFGDHRGFFSETYNEKALTEKGIDFRFVQDNHSFTGPKGTIRGLHFQAPPFAQDKLVRVIKGSIFDVAVDLRKSSPTYGEWESVELTQDNKWMYWIPPGFAHGFVTLEDNTVFFYKCTNVYNKSSEGSILWNDPELNIDWRIDNPTLSEKDKVGPTLKEFNSPF